MNDNSSEQYNNREAVITSTAQEISQHASASKEPAIKIQTRHVLLLGTMTAIGSLSADMYLPSLPIH